MTGGDSYLPGLDVLGQSLLRTGTPYPRVVMATSDVPASARQHLRNHGWLIRPVEPIPNPCPVPNQLYPRFANVFTKLRAWELTEYDQVLFVDGDTLVMRNLDALFERPGPIAAAPDFFMPDQFNSGCMVLQPAATTFAAMREALSVTSTYDGGDQGFLNQYFNWYKLPSDNRLPSGFNLHHFIYQFMHHHPAMQEQLGEKVHVIHYTLQKPWQHRLMVMGGAELWWNLYFAVHPKLDRPWKRFLHRSEDRLFEYAVGCLER
jgi:glycogenin glucosyltransferase